MSDLIVTTIQSDLNWEHIEANLASFEVQLNAIQEQTDLVILPEMFTTGFTMNAKAIAEPMDGKSIEWMAKQAQQLDAVITGSLVICEKGQYFNRLIWMYPNGQYEYYDKRHLFKMANEHEVYTAGEKKLIIEYKNWKICPLICYDLRFPVWARNTEDYDLLFYIANFPKRRIYAWEQLLIARAIENQAYTIGVNRIGQDANNIEYSGNTMLIDPAGKILYKNTRQTYTTTSVLSKSNLEYIRAKLPFLNDRDTYMIQ